MNSYKVKLYLNNFLTVLNAIGTLLILILLVNLVYKLNGRIRAAHAETAQAVAQVQETQRQQLKVQECWFALLGSDRTATITMEQLDNCIKGTPFEQKKSSQTSSTSSNSASTPSNPGTTVRTVSVEPAVVVPAKRSTDTPAVSQPTTSAPPPNPNPTQPITPPSITPQPQPVPLLQGILQPAGQLVTNLVNTLGL